MVRVYCAASAAYIYMYIYIYTLDRPRVDDMIKYNALGLIYNPIKILNMYLVLY